MTDRDREKSSRLFITNLPKYVDSERLKSHFSLKGEITDSKVVMTSDGISRRFGYIGFRTEAEASQAQKYFDRTYIDSSKISVNFAKKYGDSSLPRPWSRYSVGSSAYSREQEKEKEKDPLSSSVSAQEKKGAQRHKTKTSYTTTQESLLRLANPKEGDDGLAEFLAVHESRNKEKTWANDTEGVNVGVGVNRKEKETKVIVDKERVESKRAGGHGVFLERTHVRFDDDDSEGEDVVNVVREGEGGGGEGEGMTDLDWLASKVVPMDDGEK